MPNPWPAPKEIREMLKQYHNLMAKCIVDPKTGYEYRLICRTCNDELTIEQVTNESSDLRFTKEQGFFQGKPCISDGSAGVRCGCGTEYEAIEWEPY